MKLYERLQKKITMTVLQRQSSIIVTMLSTIFLLSIWPRFLSDALSLRWYAYLILIIFFSIPLFRKNS